LSDLEITCQILESAPESQILFLDDRANGFRIIPATVYGILRNTTQTTWPIWDEAQMTYLFHFGILDLYLALSALAMSL
jgi:hypothetical protein